MIASIHYHLRGSELVALAALCNDCATDDFEAMDADEVKP
jgi:hypothetical protein